MAVRTVGRNDPCPCGSGKKYKKCCIGSTFQPAPMPTYYTSPSSQPRAATPRKPVGTSQAASDGIPEYVFVKNKGLTHRNELRPGDECRLKDGEWAIYRPDLMNGGSVYVKDRGWIPEDELKPGDQYEHDGVWVTFQPERTIGTTEEHPFYVKDKGWTKAGELKEGDLLRTAGGWVPVTGVRNTGRVETVYNLRVADYHTYFVGAPEWGFAVWAHNACVRLVVDADTGKAYVYFNKVKNPVEFKTAAEAEQWMQKVGHTHYVVSPTPPKAFPGTKTVDIKKIKPAPSVQRDVADAGKLENHGFFDWDVYQPIQVYEKNGVYYYQNGMTRVTNAERFGVTELPVTIVSGP